MAREDIAIVAHLAAEWRQWQCEPGFPFAPDHCINGTRVAIRSLARLGVKARPVSVEFIIFNKPALDLYARGVPPAEWPPHAWSIGRGPDTPWGEEDETPGKWNGHLVCEGSGWTLDISAGQFHRPGRIRVDGARVIPGNLPPADQRAHFTDDYGQVLYLGRWPENNLWRHSGGWRRMHDAEVSELLRRMIDNYKEGEDHREGTDGDVGDQP